MSANRTRDLEPVNARFTTSDVTLHDVAALAGVDLHLLAQLRREGGVVEDHVLELGRQVDLGGLGLRDRKSVV